MDHLTIKIGKQFNSNSFDPSLYELCISDVSNTLMNERRHLLCEKVHIGRYVALIFEVIGTVSLCEVEVYSRQGIG